MIDNIDNNVEINTNLYTEVSSETIDAGSFTLRGFSADKSQNAIHVIDEYIDSIETAIKNVDSAYSDDVDKALKGKEQQSKVYAYIQCTINELIKVAEFLKAFNTGLKRVAINYEKKQAGINVNEVQDAQSATGYTSDEDVSGVTPFNG